MVRKEPDLDTAAAIDFPTPNERQLNLSRSTYLGRGESDIDLEDVLQMPIEESPSELSIVAVLVMVSVRNANISKVIELEHT